jgi:hypothetical protein
MSVLSRREDAKLLSGLAGAVALAAGSQAYAIVPVATPADLAMPASGATGGPVLWNVNGDAIQDFSFEYRFPNTTGATGVVWQANMNPVNGVATGTSVVGFRGPFIAYAQRLALGDTIGTQPTPNTGAGSPGLGFRRDTQVTLGSVYRSGGVPSPYGGFSNGAINIPPGGGQPGGSTGFVGFRVGQGATARFGWLEIDVRQGGGDTGPAIDFIAAALGDPGEIVFAGVIPEPTSLAALALGALAVLHRPGRRN